jgi:hypothetical protein
LYFGILAKILFKLHVTYLVFVVQLPPLLKFDVLGILSTIRKNTLGEKHIFIFFIKISGKEGIY